MIKSKFLTLLCFAIFLLLACSGNEDPIIPVPEPTCADNLKNGDETDVDCGGSCQPCDVTKELNIPTSGYSTPSTYDGYDLIWSDEFDNAFLDDTKWSYNLGTGCPSLCGWGNNEQQSFTDKSTNLFFKDGNLIISARNEITSGKNYSSARINTDDKFETKFGRIDIRASMPSATGTWVALFMLNKKYSIAEPAAYWPNGGEIDIMEYLGEDPNDILGTGHYGTDFPTNHRFDSKHFEALNEESYDEVFYVFSIIWENDNITWLVNDQPYHSITPETTSAKGQPYPFNDEFFFVFALSVGGNLPQSMPNPTDFPTYLIVDYIRVFQEKQ